MRYALRDAGLIEFTEELLPQGYMELIFPGSDMEWNERKSSDDGPGNGNTAEKASPAAPAEKAEEI